LNDEDQKIDGIESDNKEINIQNDDTNNNGK